MTQSSARSIRTITPTVARRLAITKQLLAGPQPDATPEGLLRTIETLGCLQLDPISAVARSHLLVLFSRVGNYKPAHIEALQFKDRRLFEYWAHEASIVPTSDYPIHQLMMQRYRSGHNRWGQATTFMAENHAMRQHILDELAAKGPQLSRQFEDKSASGWESSGWTSGRNVSRMLDFLWMSGEIMVTERQGGQKIWDLAERVLPDWTPRDALSEDEMVRIATQRSLRALGVATPKHITAHYIRRRYPNLKPLLAALVTEGVIERVSIAADGQTWPGEWYLHRDDIPLLEQLQADEWQPRTTLLSPFDNLICDRDRTHLMFDFFFRIEIYVPKHLRQYGYYVLPILHGDRLIGRIDPTMDRKNKQLTVNAIYLEPGAPTDKKTAKTVGGNIEQLAAFLGAKTITYGDNLPERWKSSLG